MDYSFRSATQAIDRTATYFNSAGVLTSAATNAPRFDYNPATLAAQGLLIEESRANLLLQSEDFDNATWSAKTAVTITTNTTSAPNGTSTADTITEDATTNQHLTGAAASGGVSSGTTYTFSCFVKQGSGTRKVFLTSFGEGYSVFDPTTGAVVQAGGNVCTATNVGNGWWRFSAAITKTNTNSGFFIGLWSTTNNYAGDGTSSLIFWGAQLEAGAFPTSYIPTTTTALTRAADVASVNTLSPWYNSVEGTLYGEFAVAGYAPTSSFSIPAVLSDNTNNNVISVANTNTGANLYSYGEINTGGVSQAGFYGASGLSFGVGSVRKSAIAYAANNFAFTTQGAAVQTDTSGTVPTVSRLYVGVGATGGSLFLNGYLRRVSYYPTRLSNAQLQVQ